MNNLIWWNGELWPNGQVENEKLSTLEFNILMIVPCSQNGLYEIVKF